jgi:MFS transporter, DHA3 family, macrolide efflux protein
MTHFRKEGLYNVVHWAACLVLVYICTLCDKPLFVQTYCLVAINLSGLLVITYLRELIKMRNFLVIWTGQLISLIGSGMTAFALDLWVYQQTNSVTQYALVALFNIIPPILISPIAGTLIDKWDRRRTILVSDFLAAILTGSIAILFFTGNLQVWQIALVTTGISIFGVFQRLALMTSTKLLVEEKQLKNAVGLSQISESIGSLVVPALAGALILIVKMDGVLFIDFITYIFSLFTLLLVKFPSPNKSDSDDFEVVNQPSGWATLTALKDELKHGWQYTTTNNSILSLLLYFTAINFLIGMVSLLLVPMILASFNSSVVGSILTVGGIGSLFGSLMLGLFGGEKYRLTKTMFFGSCLGFFLILAGLYPSSLSTMIAIFGGMLSFSLVNGISEILLISHVPLEIQGRVFGLQGTITASSLPVAYLVTGPLTDWVFEPLMAKNGALASTVGQIIGVGPGRGIGLLFIILGILQILITLCAYSYRPIRKLDHPTMPYNIPTN